MKNSLWKRAIVTVAFLIAGAGAVAGAAWFLTGGVSWKEEVLLHDGSKIIVQRTQYYGGRREIGQKPPIKEQTLSFTLPGSGEHITWKSEYGEDIWVANFIALALHILDQTPYIVAEPYFCRSYNKWGRPNPPYVVFKHEEGTWKRIPLHELPIEFEDFNLVIETKGNEKAITSQSLINAEIINQLNRNLKIEKFQKIFREPLKNTGCEVLIQNENGGWRGLDYFTMRKSSEACIAYCKEKKLIGAYCPCDQIFEGK